MSNKKLTGTLIPKDNKKAKMHATFYSDKPIGGGGDSEIFNEHIDATDEQRNTALANVSNQTANSTTGKMGYKVLDGSKSFASQVTAENTIYEIRDVFDLGGTQETPVSVALPAGSTLKFNGGAIKNCTLQCSLTQIQDDVSFDNVVITGSVKNAELKLSWWKLDNSGNDNTYAINNKNLQCLLTSSYNTSKAAIIDIAIRVTEGFVANHDLICEQYISYYGSQEYNGSVLTISGSNKNYRLKVNNANYSGTYETRKEYPIIGVKVSALTMSNIFVDEIANFTSNLVLQSTSGNDNSFGNDFYIGRLRNGYKNLSIRLSSTGWITESRFIGGWYQTNSDIAFTGHSIAVAFEGTGVTCNNLVWENCDFEGSNIGIYVNNAVFNDSKFINIRNEGVTNLIIEENVPKIVYYYRNTVSLYRNGAEARSDASYNLFKIVSDASQNKNKAVWNLNGILTDKYITLRQSIINTVTPSGVGYIAPYHVLNKNDIDSEGIPYVSTGSYLGAAFLIEHNGSLVCKINSLKSSGANGCQYNIYVVEKQLTYKNSAFRYKVWNGDLSTISIKNSGPYVNTGSTIKYINGALTSTQGCYTGNILLTNLPSDTYIILVVQGSLKHIEVETDLSNPIRTFEKTLVGYGKAIKLLGNDFGTIRYYDYYAKEFIEADFNTDTDVTYKLPIPVGTTDDRPNALPDRKMAYDYIPYFDSNLKKLIFNNQSIVDAISSKNIGGNGSAINRFENNTLTQGKPYYISISQLHKNAVIKIQFTKTDSSTEDAIVIEPDEIVSYDSSRDTLYTKMFIAPDPTVGTGYPYINIIVDTGGSYYKYFTAKEYVSTWIDSQGYTAAISKGDTASRPTNLTADDFGFEYADSDLGKKIMWNGTDWINLDGTALS